MALTLNYQDNELATSFETAYVRVVGYEGNENQIKVNIGIYPSQQSREQQKSQKQKLERAQELFITGEEIRKKSDDYLNGLYDGELALNKEKTVEELREIAAKGFYETFRQKKLEEAQLRSELEALPQVRPLKVTTYTFETPTEKMPKGLIAWFYEQLKNTPDFAEAKDI